MTKTDLKTKANDRNVEQFLNGIDDEDKRRDCFTVLELMKQITKEDPKMWGKDMVGFGSYHYKYESGREGDWFQTGFSPRKQNLTLYLMSGFSNYEDLMEKLGKFKTGKSCLYIKKLEDIDMSVLKKLIQKSVNDIAKKYG